MQELKRYLDFCREERHYCALLAHALLSSDAARQRIVARINAVIAGAELQADALEVYVEPAVLRDHWQSLGDFRRYTPALHAARRDVLCKLLAVALAPEAPGRAAVEDFLAQPWLCPPRSKKYVSPGRWPLAAVKAYRRVQGLSTSSGHITRSLTSCSFLG